MKVFNRRSVLAAGAGAAALGAIPFPVWFQKYASAEPARVRYSTESPEGKEMLKSYSRAVGRMMDIEPGHPLSWVFQWYTHWVPGPSTSYSGKDAEIARIYDSAGILPAGGSLSFSSARHRKLAQEMWDTCQSHGNTDTQQLTQDDMFLPWHRMYAYFFERIIREMSGDWNFTLPYWNYSILDNASLPREFRQPQHPEYRWLFRNTRNPGINEGMPINIRDEKYVSLQPEELEIPVYQDIGNINGFNKQLNENLHGNVHVFVGTKDEGMGGIPTAAGDPIFWMHHCNIDRLWASWNAGGRRNPTDDAWLSKEFVFADERGRRVVVTVAEFSDIANVGYSYDHLEPLPRMLPVPKAPAPAQGAAVASADTAKTLATSAAGAITLGPITVRVPLVAPSTSAVVSGQSLTPDEAHPLYLIVRGLQTDELPGVPFHVFFDMPAGTQSSEKDDYLAGTINFFNTMPTGSHGAAHATSRLSFSFEVTEVVNKLKSKGKLSNALTVTIEPVGTPPNLAAKPVIGAVLLEQH